MSSQDKSFNPRSAEILAVNEFECGEITSKKIKGLIKSPFHSIFRIFFIWMKATKSAFGEEAKPCLRVAGRTCVDFLSHTWWYQIWSTDIYYLSTLPIAWSSALLNHDLFFLLLYLELNGIFHPWKWPMAMRLFHCWIFSFQVEIILLLNEPKVRTFHTSTNLLGEIPTNCMDKMSQWKIFLAKTTASDGCSKPA